MYKFPLELGKQAGRETLPQETKGRETEGPWRILKVKPWEQNPKGWWQGGGGNFAGEEAENKVQ